MDEHRQPEDAVGAEGFVERAAEEIHGRHPRGPDYVVDADVFRKHVVADAVADEGFERRPDEADRRRPTDVHQEDRRQRGKEHAQRQAGSHAGEAGLERREVAETLGEAPALPGGERVDQAAQRRDREVAEVAEAEAVAQQEEEVAAKVRRGQGVEPFEHEEDGFGLPGMHGAAVQRGGGASREIAAMTWRLYHFTAIDPGNVCPTPPQPTGSTASHHGILPLLGRLRHARRRPCAAGNRHRSVAGTCSAA